MMGMGKVIKILPMGIKIPMPSMEDVRL